MAAAAAACRHYRGLTWLGRARRAGGAPESDEEDVNRKLCVFKIVSKSISTFSIEYKIGH